MKVLVCFKIVNDYDHVLPDDWKRGARLLPDVAYAGELYSCFDEAALELALSLKDQDAGIYLEALTVGTIKKRLTGNLLALGFDQVTVAETEREPEFASLAVAEQISRFVRETGPWDVILMGNRAGAADSSRVPFYTAQALKLPCVSQITELAVDGAAYSATVRSCGKVTEQQMKLRLPAVFTVGNIAESYLRMATLKDKLAAKKKEIRRQTGEISMEPADMELHDLLPNTAEKDCELLVDGSVAEKAERLIKLLEPYLNNQQNNRRHGEE